MLTFVDTADMEIQDGDFVLVIDSYTKVKALQDSAHGGWNEGMRKVHIRLIIKNACIFYIVSFL